MSKQSRHYQKLLGTILSIAILLTGITACSGETDHAASEANSIVTGKTESDLVSETAVFQAIILEIQDGSYLVEPVEGSSELRSADRIIVFLNGAEPFPDLEAGDIIEITYDGMIAETYPAQISNVFCIRVVEKYPGSGETKEEEILRKMVCGARYGTSFFADGSWRGYWVLEYGNEKFQYNSSFTCPGPGSAGFEFTSYDFSDGICTGSELFYCELEGNGIYESYEDAFTGFFQKQGVEMIGEACDYGKFGLLGLAGQDQASPH